MAEIDLYSYKKSNTILNRLHPTLKIVLTAFISISATRGTTPTIIYYLLLVNMGVFSIHRSFKPMLNELKYLFFLFISLSFFQALGGITPLTSIALSGIYTLKIWIVINLGSIFITTTYPGDIGGGVYRVIPFKKLAEMISLAIKTIPSFLIGWSKVNLALKSRGLYLIKNPVRFLKALTLPLLVETFRRSDAISNSMESRYYNGWVKIPLKNREISPVIILLSTLPSLIQRGMLLLQDL